MMLGDLVHSLRGKPMIEEHCTIMLVARCPQQRKIIVQCTKSPPLPPSVPLSPSLLRWSWRDSRCRSSSSTTREWAESRRSCSSPTPRAEASTCSVSSDSILRGRGHVSMVTRCSYIMLELHDCTCTCTCVFVHGGCQR